MLIKLFGALCVGGGCSLIGYHMFMQLENRVRLLSAFCGLCDRLVGEIGFHLTPLPEISAKMENPVLDGFWKDVEKVYQPYGGETYADAWKKASVNLDLLPLDRNLVAEIGDVLGQYDAENQTRSLGAIRSQLNISLDMAREQRQKQGKMAGMLGVLCGALLIVILI